MKHTGACLCGKCTFFFESDKVQVGACHCSLCRKWCGGPCMGIHVESQVDMSACKKLQWFDSSDWGKRGFCLECGSNLFWSTKDESMIVPFAGSLDDQSCIEFSEEIFIDKKPEFYRFANDTKKKTEAEVFAEFSEV